MDKVSQLFLFMDFFNIHALEIIDLKKFYLSTQKK